MDVLRRRDSHSTAVNVSSLCDGERDVCVPTGETSAGRSVGLCTAKAMGLRTAVDLSPSTHSLCYGSVHLTA